MTVYTFDELDFYIDDDAVSAFVDDNAEAVIIAEQLIEFVAETPAGRFRIRFR